MYEYPYYDKPINQKIYKDNILYYRFYSNTKNLLYRFLKKEERCLCTTMLFPTGSASIKEGQAQQLNYDNFIRIMAEMIQKYEGQI